MNWPAARAALDAAVLDTFGEPAEYRPGGTGEPVPIVVVVSRSVAAVGDYGGISERRTQVRFSRADVPAPAPGDTVALGVDVLTVDQLDPERSDDLAVTCWVR